MFVHYIQKRYVLQASKKRTFFGCSKLFQPVENPVQNVENSMPTGVFYNQKYAQPVEKSVFSTASREIDKCIYVENTIFELLVLTKKYTISAPYFPTFAVGKNV